MQQTLTIGAEGVGRRCDMAVLAAVRALPGCATVPRQVVIAALRDGRILVDTTVTKPSLLMSGGERVTFDDGVFVVVEGVTPNPTVSVRVIYEDAQVVIVDKPAGLQVHPVMGGDGVTLVHGLLARYPEMAHVGDTTPDGRLRPGIVHRLDRDTAGLMVVARTQAAWEELKTAFHDRTVRKSYRAAVWGQMMPGESGVIDLPIARAAAGDRWVALRTPRDHFSGTVRPALTEYVVVATDGERSIVDLAPRTGRTHQIRVHLQAIGHPLVGDTLYGRRDRPNDTLREPYHLLCAYRLVFVCGGRRYDVAIPLPQHLRA